MSSCRPRSAESALLAALLALACGGAQGAWFGPPCPGPALIPVADYEVLLRVRRDELDAGSDHGLRVLRDGRMQARPQTLREWGLKAREGSAQPDGDGGFWQALDAVSGLEYRYDGCTQELLLDLSRTRRAPLVRAVRSSAPPPPQAAATPGGYANFDVQAVSGQGDSWSALTELGAFAGAGHGTAAMLTRESRAIRLDTAWTLDDPAALRQWIFGDAIAREAPGRRPVRYGGLSWGTEFALQPDIVTFPLPALRGDAVLPSTVDVYVDGVLRQRDEVPAGPFELQGVPVTSGGGEMRAVVRDLLGREQTLAQPFYVSPGLLRAGLSDYRLEGGWLRRAYGLRSNDYGPAFAAASYRRGLSDWYTGALSADASRGRGALGAGLEAQLGGRVNANLELSASHAEAGSGGQALLGLQRSARRFSAALELRAATARYAALGEEQAPPKYALSAFAGLPLAGGGSLSATAVLQDSRQDQESLRLYSASYSRRMGEDFLLGIQLTHTRTAADEDVLGGASLTWLLGRGSASGYVQRSGTGTLARAGWQRQPSQTLGLGYQLDLEHSEAGGGAIDRGLGQLRWSAERGILSAAAEAGDQGSALRYGLQTGLAFIGRDFFATRPVQGSFAVVDAGGAPGVRVYHDQQLAARTGETGRALVPDLRPYEVNRIRIELDDLPIEQRADAEQLTLVPYARSGVQVNFPVTTSAGQRWLRLRMDSGAWLPPGARAYVVGGLGEVLMGTEGRMLLQGVSGEVQVQAQWPGGRCRSVSRPRLADDPGEEVLLCSAE